MKNKVRYGVLIGLLIISGIFYSVSHDGNSTLSKLKSLGEQGDVEAQYALGLMYFYGEGVDLDYQQAKVWYEKAAAQNSAQAQVKLADMYDNGIGISQNYQQAKAW